jgi:hypothetical protein
MEKLPTSLHYQARIAFTCQSKDAFDDEKAHAVRLDSRIAKIMKARGWQAKATRKYNATTNVDYGLPV